MAYHAFPLSDLQQTVQSESQPFFWETWGWADETLTVADVCMHLKVPCGVRLPVAIHWAVKQSRVSWEMVRKHSEWKYGSDIGVDSKQRLKYISLWTGSHKQASPHSVQNCISCTASDFSTEYTMKYVFSCKSWRCIRLSQQTKNIATFLYTIQGSDGLFL